MLFIVFIYVVCKYPYSVWTWTTMGYYKVVRALSPIILGIVLALVLLQSIAVFSSLTSLYYIDCVVTKKGGGYGLEKTSFFQCHQIVPMLSSSILWHFKQGMTWLITYNLLLLNKTSFLQLENVVGSKLRHALMLLPLHSNWRKLLFWLWTSCIHFSQP